MKISIYVDEDSQSSSLIQALSTRGVDVISAQQAGMLSRLEQELLSIPPKRAEPLTIIFLRLVWPLDG